jgi:Flp pilus assembly protein TadD
MAFEIAFNSPFLQSVAMRRELWIGFLLLAITLGVFSPVTRCDFLNYDDDAYVTNNPHVVAGLTTASVTWAFTTGKTGNWHPLTWLSHMLDCQLHGLKPAGHHLTNLLFHAVNVLLLFALLRLSTGAVWRSALVAALFAWHPMHVESVAWIAERKDVLSTFFGLLTLGAYGLYVRQPHAKSGKRGLFYALALLLYAMSLMSKPMLVTLPFVLLLLDYWPLRRADFRGVRPSPGAAMDKPAKAASFPRPAHPSTAASSTDSDSGATPLTHATAPEASEKEDAARTTPSPPRSGGEGPREVAHSFRNSASLSALILEKLPFFALSLACSVITLILQHADGALLSASALPVRARLANASVSYLRYIGKLLWPGHLAVLYPIPPAWPPLLAAAGALFVLGTSAVVLLNVSNRPFLPVGWFWFIGTLVPVIGLVQAGSQAMADRYSYLPYVGLFIIIAWGLGEIATRLPHVKTALLTLASAGLIACILCTRQQLRYWQDSLALFDHTVSVTSDNPIALCDLAVDLMDRGRFDEGITRAQQALALQPDMPRAEAALGYGFSGDLRSLDAIAHYRKALQLDPLQPETLNNLAFALATDPDQQNRNGGEAVRLSQQACALTENGNSIYLGTLAAACAEAGLFDDAAATNEKAIALAAATGKTNDADEFRRRQELYRLHQPFHLNRDPGAQACLAGEQLARQGNVVGAIENYRQALQLSPNLAQAINNLAWLLATTGDARNRNGPEAVRLAQRACELAGNRTPQFAGTLAAAYAETGRFDDAIASANKAIELATAQGNTAIAAANRSFLELYRAHQPFRQNSAPHRNP